MNDLSGLSWNPGSSSSNTSSNPNANRPPPQYSAFKPSTSPSISRQPTPNSASHSGRNSPFSPPAATAKQQAHHDSFSNLLPTNLQKRQTTLTLQERQKQLLEEKNRQVNGQDSGSNGQQGNDAAIWAALESHGGRSTPGSAKPSTPVAIGNSRSGSGDDDILAAFNASAPVDSSSHFPPSHSRGTPDPHTLSTRNRNVNSPVPSYSALQVPEQSQSQLDDDDPFGLGQMSHRATPSPQPAPINDDDDILGDLGKPVSEVVSKVREEPSNSGKARSAVSPDSADPRDRALAELVEMGFPVRKCKIALAHTENGHDIQAAIGWLLNQAHSEAKSQSSSRTRGGIDGDSTSEPTNATPRLPPTEDVIDDPVLPPRPTAQQRVSSRSTQRSEKDPSQVASEWGNSLFKSANALWKTGQKQLHKAMADFTQEGDGSTPRWMRDGQMPDEATETNFAARPARNPESSGGAGRFTNEANLLDTERPSSTKSSSRQTQGELEYTSRPPQRPARPVGPPTPEITARPSRPNSRLTRQVVEEQSSQAYVSPARRKKASTPVPAPAPVSVPTPPPAEETLDIFADQASVQPRKQTVPSTRSKPTSTSQPKAAPPPPRQTPPVAATKLAESTTHRLRGTESFKRGDYAAAQAAYTAALLPLPKDHPLAIILLCNRAATQLKTGDAKLAIADADAALTIIGPSRGESESIALLGPSGDADKPMKEFFGKALMRKAEALEHMEKWNEAAAVWRQAVEAGVGGNVSIQGRNRCDKAAGASSDRSSSKPPVSSSKATSAPPRPKPAPPKKSTMDDLNPTQVNSEAVRRLRAQNEAAAAASDEAFALNDTVEARLNSWKNGKEGNLRALLASLDTVLWEGANWKKVGMSDLVLSNKVKVVYMKAIAKVHPDKIPTDATTEQRMISAAVFATVNEAWDKFKKDNGL